MAQIPTLIFGTTTMLELKLLKSWLILVVIRLELLNVAL